MEEDISSQVILHTRDMSETATRSYWQHCILRFLLDSVPLVVYKTAHPTLPEQHLADCHKTRRPPDLPGQTTCDPHFAPEHLPPTGFPRHLQPCSSDASTLTFPVTAPSFQNFHVYVRKFAVGFIEHILPPQWRNVFHLSTTFTFPWSLSLTIAFAE